MADTVTAAKWGHARLPCAFGCAHSGLRSKIRLKRQLGDPHLYLMLRKTTSWHVRCLFCKRAVRTTFWNESLFGLASSKSWHLVTESDQVGTRTALSLCRCCWFLAKPVPLCSDYLAWPEIESRRVMPVASSNIARMNAWQEHSNSNTVT